MGKKDRNKKKDDKKIKETLLKTEEERDLEVKDIINTLNSLKLTVRYDGVLEFYKILNEFKKTGNSWTGKIPFPQFGREVQGFLTNKANSPSQIKLVVI